MVIANIELNPEKYPVFRDIVGRPELIRESDYSTVLGLSKKHVVKIPLESFYNLEEEYQNHVELYQADLPVPKPIGIFRFSPPQYRGECGVGLVMQRLKGINGEKTRGKTRRRVEFELANQLSRCVYLGFRPFDEGLHNCIWDSKSEKLYLIDFIGWRKRQTPQVGSLARFS